MSVSFELEIYRTDPVQKFPRINSKVVLDRRRMVASCNAMDTNNIHGAKDDIDQPDNF
jgi:hypothetical protein